MRTRRIGLLTLTCGLFATEPNDAMRRWWSHVQALSKDSMQGRDTGSAGYRQAAAYVVPLKRGGADAPSNMQRQTTAEAKAKDWIE